MNEPEQSLRFTRLCILAALLVGAAIPLRAAGVAAQQGALALGLLLALIVLSRDGAARANLKAAILSLPGRFAMAVFIAFAATIPFSHEPLGSLKIGGRTGLFLLAAMVLWALLKTRTETHRPLFKALIVTSFTFAIIALISLSGVNRIVWLFRGDVAQFITPGLGYANPTTLFKAFAATSMCLIPTLAWAGRRLEGHWRWWGYAFAPLALGIIVLTYNRSALAGFIAMAVAGIVLLALAKRRHARALLATVLAGASGTIAWVALKEIRLRDALEQSTGQTIHVDAYLPYWLLDAHRQNIWKFAFQRFLDHPLFGNGIDQLNRLPGAHNAVPGLESYAAVIPSHPHNWALEILAETGMLGFTAVVIALGFVAWRLAKQYLKTDDAASLALFTLMAGFWASALFNFSIWAVWWQLTFFVLFAIIAATRDQPPA